MNNIAEQKIAWIFWVDFHEKKIYTDEVINVMIIPFSENKSLFPLHTQQKKTIDRCYFKMIDSLEMLLWL
jgi:hypothetical protein